MRILYITYDPETSRYCGIYRASIEYINSMRLVYNKIDQIGLNKFNETNIVNLYNYDIVIIHTSLSEKVKKAIHKIKVHKRVKICLLIIYETENIPSVWRDYSRGTDMFIVPTYLMKNILINNGYKEDIYVVQHNIQNRILELADRKSPCFYKDYYVFYTNSKIDDPRKNISNLIRTYLKTFTNKDKVFLYIKGYQNNKVLNNFAIKPDSPLLKIDTRNVSDDDIINIHLRCNCYISLAHSEGVGWGMLEASTLGKPVITTGYGGQMEYINDGYFVDYKLDKININYSYFNSNQFWAYPNYNHASKILREVYNNQEKAKEIGEKNKIYVTENFNSLKIGNKFISIINNFLEKN